MSLPTDNPEPSKRVSITKAQLHEGAASELLALLEEITADGKVSSDEAKALSAWLSASEATGIPGILYLRGILEHVLSDGILSADEHKAVYDAIEKILPIELRREARERRKLALATEKMRITSIKEAQRAEAERQRPFLDLDLMVAGSSHGNRQKVIREEVQVNQQIILHREPDNPYDCNAIMVLLPSGSDIGYISRGDAEDLAPLLDGGRLYKGYIKKVHPGSTANIPVVVIQVFSPEAGVEGVRPAGQRRFQAAQVAAKGAGCGGCLIVLALPVMAIIHLLAK